MAGEVVGMSRVEAERIVAILDDTIEKLGFLDSITPDLLQHRDELSKFIGDEISRTMVEQKGLERRYEELIEQRAAMKGMVDKNKYKEVQEEIQDVSRSLRESTNNLVRSLKENPNVSGNLIKVQRDRTDLTDLLIRCAQELHDKATYQNALNVYLQKTIASEVEEEKHTRQRLARLQAKERVLKNEVKNLEEKLGSEQRSFVHTTSQQRMAISQLRDDLLSIRGRTSMDAKFKKKESSASVAAVCFDYQLKERVLETKLKELRDRLRTEAIVHGETRDFFARKHMNFTESISSWDARYLREVGAKDEETKDINLKRKKVLDRLSELQFRKDSELAHDAQEVAKAYQVVLELKQGKALLNRQNAAAVIIVREFREYMKYKNDLNTKKVKGKKGKKISKEKKKEKM